MTKADPYAILLEHAIPVLAALLRDSCLSAERHLKEGAVHEALAVAAEAEAEAEVAAGTNEEDSDAVYRKKSEQLNAVRFHGLAHQHGDDVAAKTTALTAALREVREGRK